MISPRLAALLALACYVLGHWVGSAPPGPLALAAWEPSAGHSVTDPGHPFFAAVKMAQASEPGDGLPDGTPERCRQYAGPILAAARDNGLDPAELVAMLIIESGCQASVTSHAGAMGMAQVMPGTADGIAAQTGLPCRAGAYDAETSIRCGAWYLGRQKAAFGTFELGMIAYNAGPGGAQTYQRSGWLPNETRAYQRWSGMYAGPGRLDLGIFHEWCAAGSGFGLRECGS